MQIKSYITWAALEAEAMRRARFLPSSPRRYALEGLAHACRKPLTEIVLQDAVRNNMDKSNGDRGAAIFTEVCRRLRDVAPLMVDLLGAASAWELFADHADGKWGRLIECQSMDEFSGVLASAELRLGDTLHFSESSLTMFIGDLELKRSSDELEVDFSIVNDGKDYKDVDIYVKHRTTGEEWLVCASRKVGDVAANSVFRGEIRYAPGGGSDFDDGGKEPPAAVTAAIENVWPQVLELLKPSGKEFGRCLQMLVGDIQSAANQENWPKLRDILFDSEFNDLVSEIAERGAA